MGTRTNESLHNWLLSNLGLFPCRWSLFPILVTPTPPHPPQPPNCMIKLRFVANPFATIPPKVTSTKLHFNEEFGHFYFSFFQFLETVVFLGLFWAYYRVFWAPTNLQKPSMELIYSEYVCVWVREQNRAFIWDFWVVCDFSLQGCHFSPFWSLWGHVFQLWPRCLMIGWNR